MLQLSEHTEVEAKPPTFVRLKHKLQELLAIMQNDPAVSLYLKPVKRLALRTLIPLGLSELFMVAQVFPVKFFIDELSGARRLPVLLSIVAMMTVIYKTGGELRRMTSKSRTAFKDAMWVIWWGYGHRRELRLSADWHTAHSTGEKESLVAHNIVRFEGLVMELLFETIPVTMRIAFTTVFMFLIGWQFGVVSLATMVVYYAMLWRNDRQIQPLRETRRKQLRALERFGSEMTVNWQTIKSLGMEEEFSDRNEGMLLEYAHDELGRTAKQTRLSTFQDDIVSLSRCVLYGTIALTITQSHLALGTIVLATTWMERTYSNYVRYEDFQQRMNEGVVALEELVDLMCLEPTVRMPDHPIAPAVSRGEVVFDAASFRYDDAPDCVLKDVSLKVEAGKTVAIVGMSGCGKSTLMTLLARQNDPTTGSIRKDGVDLRDLDYKEYRQKTLGIISQQPQLFTMSIMENIRLGYPAASDEEVIEAAKRACAHDFVMSKPDGYHSVVGENGVNLSGGERQRLAIARALVRRPEILIMDEATSALDALSQHKFQETIDALIASRSCTTFIVAHRFPTIMSADLVVVLDDGVVAEVGTHEELQRQNGLYARLRDLESRGLL